MASPFTNPNGGGPRTMDCRCFHKSLNPGTCTVAALEQTQADHHVADMCPSISPQFRQRSRRTVRSPFPKFNFDKHTQQSFIFMFSLTNAVASARARGNRSCGLTNVWAIFFILIALFWNLERPRTFLFRSTLTHHSCAVGLEMIR